MENLKKPLICQCDRGFVIRIDYFFRPVSALLFHHTRPYIRPVPVYISRKLLVDCTRTQLPFPSKALQTTSKMSDVQSNFPDDISSIPSTSEATSRSLSQLSSASVELGVFAGKYRVTPDSGKRGRIGWAWKHGFQLEDLKDGSTWWLCRRC